MSSNYPPGVTGNEPEIAGYPEPEIQRLRDENIHPNSEYGNAFLEGYNSFWNNPGRLGKSPAKCPLKGDRADVWRQKGWDFAKQILDEESTD